MPPSPILKAMRELAEFLGKRMDAVTAAVKDLSKKPDMAASVKEQTRTMETTLRSLERAIKSIDTTFKGEVAVDTTALETELKTALAALKKLDMPDLGPVTRLLQMTYDCLAYKLPEMNQNIVDLGTRLEAAIKGQSYPSIFKLEEQQLRALRGSMSGGLVTQPGPMQARAVTLANVSMASANTEYSYTFPARTVGFTIKLRSQSGPLLYAWATGKLPTSGDGSAYLTVPQNFLRSPEGVEFSGKTIYLQTASASMVAEIESYQY